MPDQQSLLHRLSLEGGIRAVTSIAGKVGRKAIDAARSSQYHGQHKKEALQALSAIEADESQKLTPTLKKTVDEYSIDVFGSKRYAPWLYVYTLLRGEFKEGWMPDNFFGKIVCPRVNKELMAVTGFKTFSNIVLKTEALPDIGYYIDGKFYDRDLSVTDSSKICELARAGNAHVFVKKDRSGRGDGILKLTVDKVTDEHF